MGELKFELLGKVPDLLANLAVLADARGQELIRDVLLSSEYEVKLNADFNNLDGGQYGHALHLAIPGDLWVQVAREGKPQVEQALVMLLNEHETVEHEHFHSVALEPSDAPSMVGGYSLRSRQADADLWEDADSPRLFISHIKEHKAEAHALKSECKQFGISSFVAHDDMPPGKEWGPNLRRALASMDALLAWLTPGFRESEWTDQEVGFAVARRVPIIPVGNGIAPYGFMGEIQALSGIERPPEAITHEVVRLLLDSPSPTSDRMKKGVVARFAGAGSFDDARRLIKHLGRIESLPLDLVERVEAACEENGQIRENSELGTVKQMVKGWREQLSGGATGLGE